MINLFRLLPIPLDTLVGLYNPWRDFFATKFPNGIPFKNFLITDPVRQQIPWRFLSMQSLSHGQLPLWNPYSFSGYPLLGNFQSAGLYPLNIIFLLVRNFPIAWSILVYGQIIIGAVLMYIFLKKILEHKIAAIFGSLAWSFSGFFVSWFAHNTLVQTAIWLPLILFGSHLMTEKKFLRGATCWVIGSSFSILAGAPQISLYVFSFAIGYHLVLSYKKWSKSFVAATIISLVVTITISSIQLLTASQFLSESLRSVAQDAWQQPGWFFPIQNLLQFISPDFFGNPSTMNYFGVWNYMEFVGYIGIIPLIFSALALTKIKNKLVAFLVAATVVSFVLMIRNPISAIPYQLGLPIIGLSQPTRLLVVIDFSLTVLAAFGMKFFLTNEIAKKTLNRFLLVITIASSLFALSLAKADTVSQRNSILAVLLSFLAVLLLLIYRKVNFQRIVVLSLILLTIFDLGKFFFKFQSFSDSHYFYPETQTISFLKSQLTNDPYRIASLDDRLLPPNTGNFFELSSVDGYDSLMPRNYLELVDAFESGQIRTNPASFYNRILRVRNPQLLNLLGAKFILSLDPVENKSYKLVFTEGQTKIYENLGALPRSFFVSQVVKLSTQDELKAMTSGNVNFLKTAYVNSNEQISDQLSIGVAKIAKYQPNEVLITTQNSGEGFLVLTDNHSSLWVATIDEKPTTIVLTDHSFRGVIIPKGNHTVRMIPQLKLQ